MLNKLSKDQVAKLAEYREKWLAIGLCTKRADRKAAEKAMRDVYTVAGLKSPSVFIWLDSPLQGAYAAYLLSNLKKVRDQVEAQVEAQVGAQVWDQVRDQVTDQVRDQVGDQVGAQVWDQVGGRVWGQVEAQVWDQVGAQVRGQVWDQVWDQVRDQVGAQVWGQVRDQVGDQVGAQVWGQVGDQVWDQVWDQVRDQVYKAGHGNQDAGWLSFYDYFLNETSVKNIDKITPLVQLARNCGWFWPLESVVIMTEKPTSLKMLSGKLHSLDGPAIEYADGFKIYAVNGQRKGTLMECVLQDKYGKDKK